MKLKSALMLSIILLMLNSTIGFSQKKQKKVTTDSETESMKKFEGYFNFFYDEEKDKIFLLVDKLDQEFLYVSSLAAGIGSNDIGLDRGQLGGEKVVKFIKAGPKILLIQPNYDYRAVSENIDERRAVEQAFAQSVIWGFEVDEEQSNGFLVDATGFFMRDAHNVIGRLMRSRQGSYRLDQSRSALYPAMIKAFPENVEFEATLTFAGAPEGGYIRSVTPTPQAVTVRQHHSFIKLPDNYIPRNLIRAQVISACPIWIMPLLLMSQSGKDLFQDTD